MHDITVMILFCALGNYLLRAVPFWIPIEAEKDSPLARFLEYMPVTALGALILPGIISTFPDNPMAGIAGLAAAGMTAWFRGGLILPVTVSIAAAWLVLNF